MIRTVPATTSEGIELYIRTYYSLLRSSGDIRIRSLEETHEGMRSSLHLWAESPNFDASAFLYAALRLPEPIHRARRVVLGQSEQVFVRGGLRDVASWQRVDAAARRRRMLFDGALDPAGGQLAPDPGRPGLGLEFREADAQQYRRA